MIMLCTFFTFRRLYDRSNYYLNNSRLIEILNGGNCNVMNIFWNILSLRAKYATRIM